MIRGVNSAAAGIDLFRQAIGVGGFEFAQGAVVQDQGRQGMLVRQLLQGLLASGGLTGGGLEVHRQPQLAVEDLLNLLGRAEIEGLAGQFVGAALVLSHGRGQLPALLVQHRRIHQYPGALHP